jgi:hypothetical protein
MGQSLSVHVQGAKHYLIGNKTVLDSKVPGRRISVGTRKNVQEK